MGDGPNKPADLAQARHFARYLRRVCGPDVPGVEMVEALVGEIERLRAEAHRFYRADGTWEALDSPEEVVRRRIAAAGEIERLRAENARLNSTLARILDWHVSQFSEADEDEGTAEEWTASIVGCHVGGGYPSKEAAVRAVLGDYGIETASEDTAS